MRCDSVADDSWRAYLRFSCFSNPRPPPPRSPADVQFMQGMIMHHAQAVEMTALIESHTENKDLRLLGARISHSQSEEIKFMTCWLASRGESTSLPMKNMGGMDMSM